MENNSAKKKKKISLFAKISFLISLIVFILLWISKSSPSFADGLNGSICHGFRVFMAGFGGLTPFSIYEIVMLSLPLLIVFLVILAVRSFKSKKGIRFVINFAAFILLFLSGHNLSLGIAYNSTPIDEKMGIEPVEVTEERLASVLTELRDEINILSGEISFSNGVSLPGCSFENISEKLCRSYENIYEKYSFPKTFDSVAKKVAFSNFMSYMGITGIYTFFSGDANVNSDYPYYVMTFTAAHELAHQRGIARENEANFMAYLVTSSSSDPYLRYSGALYMYEYIGAALYKTDKELYKEIDSSLSSMAKSDISASRAVSEKYGDTVINDISTFFNDLFLKSNGTEGVVSYGKVVSLTVSYFENKNGGSSN